MGAYWKLADDGAKFRCKGGCGKYFRSKDVVITKPHKIICMDCIDDDWFAKAEYKGFAESLQSDGTWKDWYNGEND